jgi:hypothetical protein
MTVGRLLRRSTTAALLLAGCSLVGSDGGEQLGIIQSLPDKPAQVTVPATARAGESFTVSVMTYGGGCTEQGPTRVHISGTTAEVRPYDRDTGRNDCPANSVSYEHTATLRFDEPGTARVHVYGIGYPERNNLLITRLVTITAAGG